MKKRYAEYQAQVLIHIFRNREQQASKSESVRQQLKQQTEPDYLVDDIIIIVERDQA